MDDYYAYVNARIVGHEGELTGDWDENVKEKQRQFARTLKRLKEEGYKIDDTGDIGNHKIRFENGPEYRIPGAVKGEFLDRIDVLSR